MRCATKSALERVVVRTSLAVWASARSVCAKGTRALLTGTSLSRNGTLIGVFPVSRKRRAGPLPTLPRMRGRGGRGFSEFFRLLELTWPGNGVFRRSQHPKEATLTNAGPRDSIPSGTADRIGIDAAEILNSGGEVAYDWRIDTDALHWGANAAAVLLVPDIAAVSTGRAYAQVLEAENAQARFDAVMQSDKRDDGRGVAYQIQYCIRPDPTSDTRLWVEDIGRWFAGPDRKPVRAHGVVRVINERYEHVRRLTYLARYDGLTSELSRHHLTEVLEDTLDEAIPLGSSCS